MESGYTGFGFRYRYEMKRREFYPTAANKGAFEELHDNGLHLGRRYGLMKSVFDEDRFAG